MLLVISTVSGPEVTDWFNVFCCGIGPEIYAYKVNRKLSLKHLLIYFVNSTKLFSRQQRLLQVGQLKINTARRLS